MTDFKEYVSYNPESRFATLDLSKKELTGIPKEVSEIPEYINSSYGKVYKEIDLSYNQIHDLTDQDLEILNGFHIIHLIGFRAKTITFNIEKLTRPIVLNFSNSALTELPLGLYKLKQLASIRINWTAIQNFHPDIQQLTALQDVEVSETPFLNTIYAIQDRKGVVTNDLETQVWEVKNILDNMGCEIGE